MPAPNRYAGLAGFDIGQESAAPPRSVPDLTQSPHENIELVNDLTRFAEGLLSESAVRKKWRLSDYVWEAFGENDQLVRAIEETRIQRIRSGALKREKAQQHVIRGPDVLATIMDDPRANARHRVDSVKALDAIAAPESQAEAGQERVYIRIDLGADVRAKGMESSPNDVLVIDTTVQPKPKPIDSWDERKQLENASPRRKDDDR